MYLPDIDPLLDLVTIHYLVPHSASPPDDVSPFQMISPGIIETSDALQTIALLPRDASELLSGTERLIAARIAGRGHAVIPIQLTDFPTALGALRPRIMVVLSMTASIADAAEVSIRRQPMPVLHVTPARRTIDRATLRRHCLEVAEYWKTQGLHRYARFVIKDLKHWKDPLVKTELKFRDRYHFLTSPNVAALGSVGLTPLPWDRTPLHGVTNAPYFEALKEVVEPLVAARQRVLEENPELRARAHVDLILTVPAIVKYWDSIRRERSVDDDQEKGKVIKTVLRELGARETYSLQFSKEVGTSEFAQGMMFANREDLEVYTGVLSVRAASCFAPVFRLPTAANGVRAELRNLADVCRRSDKDESPHKANRLARSLSERLARGIPEWILDHLRNAAQIKLISDAPLEWLSVDGFPLMLRTDVSRITVTPGNLFIQQALQMKSRVLPQAAFRQILVVRSFKPDDPIRHLLEGVIKFYNKGASNPLDVRFIDVRTRAELVKALNEYDGAIAVYDGHGAHPEDSDVGQLVLSEDRVDPWFLRSEARIPPVVILAACDTHPFGASHATSANGFLAAGATTVVGTSIPVNGWLSAATVGRLLYRVADYLPLLISQRPWKSFRWSEILPGLQRRQYVTEVLRRLSGVGTVSIPEHKWKEITFSIGMSIDRGENWLDEFIDRVAGLMNVPRDKATEQILKQGGFVEALAYTQLGNPELVVGCAD